MIEIIKINESHCILKCEKSIAQEIYEYFSFLYPGYKFTPSYKARLWDGYYRLAKILPNGDIEFLNGLLHQLKSFAQDREYELKFSYTEETQKEITREHLEKFIEHLNLHSNNKPIQVRDYQFNGILDYLNNRKLVLLSPTSCMDPDTIIDVELDNVNKKISLNELKTLVESGYLPKINTPTGFESITDVYRKNGPGLEIYFDNNIDHTLKAANNHLIWFNNEWTEVVSLKIGDIINGKKITKIKYLQPQEWIDFSIDAEHESYYHNDILHHNSGKSLILYIIIRFLTSVLKKQKGLILVPNTSLVQQLYSDFKDYSSHNEWDVSKYIHQIYAGQDKVCDKKMYLSTWQSVYDIKIKKYFEQFDFVVTDECHLASASSLTGIITKCINADYRIGVTGTLNGQKIHSLQLESIFGQVKKVITTKELMDNNQVSKLKIKCIVLKYPADVSKALTKIKYQDELNYIVSNQDRNKFIKNLVFNLKGNSLILYQYVEKHGDVLYKILSESKYAKDKKIYYIHGNIKAEEREAIRKAMETENNVILLGSVGTVSTGTNIKNLHNIIFASPSKSRIRNLQAIGRILRLHDSKDKAILYDIADDLRYKKNINFTLLHFQERIKIYNEEKFDYTIHNINLNEKP